MIIFASQPEIQARLLQYGVAQKIGDSYAFGKEANATPQMAADEINAMIAQLMAGDWKAIREGGGVAETRYLPSGSIPLIVIGYSNRYWLP